MIPLDTRAQRRAAIGLAVILTFGAWVMLRPTPTIRPWPVQQYGGTTLAWNDSIRAAWADVMRCVGLDPTPDTTLALYRLTEGSSVIVSPVGAPIEVQYGWYFRREHAVVVVPGPTERVTWRHEFVHARLRSPASVHEPVFDAYASACALGDPTTWSGR
jgi:hypothetical protein